MEPFEIRERLIEEMKRFSEGAWELARFPPKAKPSLSDRHLSELDFDNLDLFEYEYLRSLDFKDDRYLFALDIENVAVKHKGDWLTDVIASIEVAKLIAKKFPDTFEYHLSGNGAHACAVIDFHDKAFKKDYKRVDAKAIYHYAAMVCEGIGTILPNVNAFLCRKIYSQGRIFKLAGSINFSASEKSGLNIFCVPFLPSQSIEEILAMSQLKEPVIRGELPKFSLYDIAQPISWKKGRGSPKVDLKSIHIPEGMRFDFESWPPCMLSELNTPEPSHMARVFWVKFLYSLGYNIDEICGFFRMLSPKDYDAAKVKYHVSYDFGVQMSGCATTQFHGICPFECGRVHPLDKGRRS
jgi:hypothetical protein